MIFLILFLYSCAYSLVIPALPPLVRQAYPDFGVSTYYAGPYIESLSSARYVVEFLLCTYLGHLSDQSGRTGMLTLALLLNAVGECPSCSVITQHVPWWVRRRCGEVHAELHLTSRS